MSRKQGRVESMPMRLVPSIIASALLCLSLSGRMGLLLALGLAALVGYPVFQVTPNLRTAVYAQELVIAVNSVPWVSWVLRKRNPKGILPVRDMYVHLFLIIAYAVVVTAIRYENIETLGGLPIRLLLTGMRFGGMAAAFLIPASMPLDEHEFAFVLRCFLLGLQGVLVLSILQFAGVLSFDSLYSAGDASVELRAGFGGFNRASTGTLAEYGLFLTVLLFHLRKVRWWVAVPSIIGFLWLIMVSLSRTNLISVCVFGLALVIFTTRSRIRNLILLAMGVALGLLIAHYYAPIVFRINAATDIVVGAAGQEPGGRLYGWGRAIDYLRANTATALMGGGYDSWADVLRPITGLSSGHNVYLHAWAELGLVGGTIYLAFFLRLVWWFLRAMRIEGDTQVTGALSFCLMLSLFVGNLTTDLFYPVPTMLSCLHATMFLFGILVARLRWALGHRELEGGCPIDSASR